MPLATRNAFNDEAFVNFDSALQFDGIDDHIVIPVNNDYNFTLNGLCISVFLNVERYNAKGVDTLPLTAANFNQAILSINRSDGAKRFRLDLYRLADNGDYYRIFFTFNGGQLFQSVNIFPRFNNWNHFFLRIGTTTSNKFTPVLTTDSRFYLNGIENSFGSTVIPTEDYSGFELKISKYSCLVATYRL